MRIAATVDSVFDRHVGLREVSLFSVRIFSSWLSGLQRSDGRLYPPRSWFSWCAIGFACLLIVGSAVIQFPWFAAVGFVIMAACCLAAMRGPEDRSLLVVALPLATFIQLPRADVILTQRLQSVTTWMSSVLLDITAIPHAVSNRVIQLKDRDLFVAEACSGIQSVFTLGIPRLFTCRLATPTGLAVPGVFAHRLRSGRLCQRRSRDRGGMGSDVVSSGFVCGLATRFIGLRCTRDRFCVSTVFRSFDHDNAAHCSERIGQSSDQRLEFRRVDTGVDAATGVYGGNNVQETLRP